MLVNKSTQFLCFNFYLELDMQFKLMQNKYNNTY